LNDNISQVDNLEKLVKMHDALTKDIAAMQAAADNVVAAINAYKELSQPRKGRMIQSNKSPLENRSNSTRRDASLVVDAIVEYFVSCENRRIKTAPLTDILLSQGVDLPDTAPMASVGRILSFNKDTFERIPPKTMKGNPEWQLIDAVFQQHRAKNKAGTLVRGQNPANNEDLNNAESGPG